MKLGILNPLFLSEMNSFTFGKEEKLCSQKLIGSLFISGNSFFCYPLKVIWTAAEENSFIYPAQAAFSVPKRNFKKAHDRNLLKRMMRESYRQRKHYFYESLESGNSKIALMVVYAAKEISGFNDIDTAMSKAISRLEKMLSLTKET